MSHGGMTAEQAQAYKIQLGSYVKPASRDRIHEIRNQTGEGLIACKRIEEKERMLAAIEEVRFETPPEQYTSAMHTVLDVLQYLVERT